MAKTITLKNLPDALHARLAAAAKRHRRSLNNEAIVCLEAGLGHEPLAVEQQLQEIRALRNSLAQHGLIRLRSMPPSARGGLDRR
jgi:plasmid stability protein